MSEATNLVDDYELRNCIATGNSSQVWEVVPVGANVSFAMKMLLPKALQDQEELKTLKHEGKVGKSLEHPNIIRFHHVVATKTKAYIVMDYFKAPNLKSQIRSEPIQAQLRIEKLVEGVCLALGHVHDKGWIHRDVKPDNILLSRSSELRLVDFSLSARQSTGLMKLMGSKLKVIQGTRTYIAPETILKKYPTPQTDMYSLGVTIYEVLAGVPPFRSRTPSELLKKHLSEVPALPSLLNPNVTKEMDDFVMRLLSKKPAERPADMGEVLAHFRSLQSFKESLEVVQQREEEEAQKAKHVSLGKRIDSRTDAERDPSAPPRTPASPPNQPGPPVQPQQGMPPQPQFYPNGPAAQQYPQQPGFPQQPGYPPQQPGPYGQPPGNMPYGMPGQPPMTPGSQPSFPNQGPQFPQQPYPGQPGYPYPQAPPGQPPQPMYPPQPNAWNPQQGPPPGQQPPGQPQRPPQGQSPPGQPPQPGQWTQVHPQQGQPPQGIQPPGQLNRPSQPPVPPGQPLPPPTPPGALQTNHHPSQDKANDEDLEFMDELPDIL